MKKRILAAGLLVALALLPCGAQTFKAHDPAWRGLWIWEAPQEVPPVLEVDLGEWVKQRPGAVGEALVNRILGNAAIAGYREIYWRKTDRQGRSLGPVSDGSEVLKYANWGLDFGAFDYPGYARKMAGKLGMRLTFEPPAGAKVSALTLDGKARFLPARPLEFCKRFAVTKAPERARLCITAHGRYTLWLDGREIGADADWTRGETYDLAALLSPGEHELTVRVEPEAAWRGLLVNFDCDGKRLDSDLTWVCRPVGETRFLPVIATGFEGAGARFRLKEPWLNPRPVGASRPLVRAKAAHALLAAPLEIALRPDRESAKTFAFSPVTDDELIVDLTVRIDARTPSLTLGILPPGAVGKAVPLRALIWLMWDGAQGNVQYFADGWKAIAPFTPGKEQQMQLILTLKDNLFAVNIDGKFAASGLAFRNPASSPVRAGAVVLIGRKGGKGQVSVNELRVNSPAVKRAPRPPETVAAPAAIDPARVQTRTFFSKALNRTRPYTVILPEKVEPQQRYPVLYMLHGRGRHERSLVEDPAALAALAAFRGVVILPKGDDGWYINSPVLAADRYGDFISELLAENARTLPIRTDRAGRGIAGWSMGGYGAVMTAAGHPEQFSAVAPIIALLDFPSEGLGYPVPEARFGTDRAVWRELNPMQRIDGLTGMKILLLPGKQCFARTMNEHFAAALAQRRHAAEWHELPGTHAFTTVVQAIPHVVDFMNRELCR